MQEKAANFEPRLRVIAEANGPDLARPGDPPQSGEPGHGDHRLF